MFAGRMILAALIALQASVALADGAVDRLMTPADKTRMKQYEATRKTALREARSGGDQTDVATLDALLAKPNLAFSGYDLTGGWQCRTMKAGGALPLVVYGWFKCQVSDDGSGWFLEKTSGSQRMTGGFYDDGDKRLIYLGSFHVSGDPVQPYGAGPQTDQVGYAFRSGPEAWRIELPAPYYESKLDIIEFKR